MTLTAFLGCAKKTFLEALTEQFDRWTRALSRKRPFEQ